MKIPHRFFLCLSVMALLSFTVAWSQNLPTTSSSNKPKVINPTTRDARLEAQPAPPTGSTVITSPLANGEQNGSSVLCTGSPEDEVYVVCDDFRMRCLTLKAYFNPAHKIDHLEADGDVVIEQPNQLTKAGHAVYTQSNDQIVLTQSPEINKNGTLEFGTIITIYRGKGDEIVQHCKIVLPPSGSSSPSLTSSH